MLYFVNSYQFVATYSDNERTYSMNMACDPRSNEHFFKHFLLVSDKQLFASALVQLRIYFTGIFQSSIIFLRAHALAYTDKLN